MKFCSICSAVALTIVLFTGAHAAVIPKDSNIKLNTYTEFNWAPTTVKKVQDFAVDLIAPARVHITDLDPYGEGFSIYDNNVFVGETSTVKTKNKPHSVKDHHYRQGFFNLEQGHHVITVKLKGNSGVGNGAIRIVPGKGLSIYH
jgi:hypothetical protein